MVDVTNDNRVLSLVARSGIRNILVTLLDQLQRCQKSLNEFLEVSQIHFAKHCCFTFDMTLHNQRYMQYGVPLQIAACYILACMCNAL